MLLSGRHVHLLCASPGPLATGAITALAVSSHGALWLAYVLIFAADFAIELFTFRHHDAHEEVGPAADVVPTAVDAHG